MERLTPTTVVTTGLSSQPESPSSPSTRSLRPKPFLLEKYDWKTISTDISTDITLELLESDADGGSSVIDDTVKRISMVSGSHSSFGPSGSDTGGGLSEVYTDDRPSLLDGAIKRIKSKESLWAARIDKDLISACEEFSQHKTTSGRLRVSAEPIDPGKERCKKRRTILSSIEISKKNKEIMSLNQLQLSNLGLYGRDGQREELKEAYKRASEARSRERVNNGGHVEKNEVVLISGSPRCGKTALVSSLREDIMRGNKRFGGSVGSTTGKDKRRYPRGLFIEGGFINNNGAFFHAPYNAFAAALCQLCDTLCDLEECNDGSMREETKEAIRKAIGLDGAESLMEVFPDLRRILVDDSKEEEQPPPMVRDHNEVEDDVNNMTKQNSIFGAECTHNNVEWGLLRNIVVGEVGEVGKAKVHKWRGLERTQKSMRMSMRESKKWDLAMKGVISCDRNLRIKHAVCQLLAAVASSSLSPLVLFLDDLQNADTVSIDLLETLLTSTSAPGLLFVGCYQEGGNVDLSRRNDREALRLFRIKENSSALVTNISVGNLGIDDINKLIVDLLDVNEVHSQRLSSIVHQRTGGNPFFIREFLSYLHDKDILYYNMAVMQWMWDDDQILSKTTVSNNVLEMIKTKLDQRLSEESWELLQMSACLGTQFDFNILLLVARSVWKKKESAIGAKSSGDDDGDNDSVPGNKPSEIDFSVIACLEQCIYEGAIEKCDSTRNLGPFGYQFTHDQIKQVVYSSIPSDDCAFLQFRIGQTLVMNFPPGDLNKILFLVVDLMNNGVNYMLPEDRTTLAWMNLRAGKMAAESSAMVSSASYLRRGLSLIVDEGGADCDDSQLVGNDTRKDKHELYLELLCTLAEVEHMNGNFKQMHEYLNALRRQKFVPFNKKLRVYLVLIQSLGAEDKVGQAIDVSLDVLEQLGVLIPRKVRRHTFKTELQKTKQLLEGMDIKSILSFPIMDDERITMVMSILDKVSMYALWAMPDLYPIVVFRMVRITIRHGLCASSAVAFAQYAKLLCGMLSNPKLGLEFGNLALSMAEGWAERAGGSLTGRETTISQVLTTVHGFVHHWTNPIHQSFRPLFHGYRTGLQSGNLEAAALCITCHCDFLMHTGQPLSLVDADCRVYERQMEECGQELLRLMAAMLCNMTRNLMGQSVDPTLLNWEANNKDILQMRGKKTRRCYILDAMSMRRACMSYYFGDYETAWNLMKECGDVSKKMPADVMVWRMAFFEGLTALALAKKAWRWTPRRSYYLRQAKRAMKRIKLWINGKNMNCIHMNFLLEAELLSLGSKGVQEAVKNAYDKAISTSGRHGFPNDKALAYERAGIYFVSIRDKFWADHYLGRALQGYLDWEAQGLADRLIKRFPHLSMSAIPLLEVI